MLVTGHKLLCLYVVFKFLCRVHVKFKDGDMKHVFKNIVKPYLPKKILSRTNKMGFSTPLNQWLSNEASDFVRDIFSSSRAQSRDLINNKFKSSDGYINSLEQAIV